MKIIIGGDLVPTHNNLDLFKSKNFINELDPSFVNIWKAADYRLFNLECPLGDKNMLTPQIKSGPNLIAPTECINGIASLKPDLVCLANNHILDYQYDGLKSTISELKKNKIEYTGIIDNINSEMKIRYFIKDNVKVGVYNLCETEFSNATYNYPGANPYDEIKTFNIIHNIKKNCDFLIVIYHGGKEFYRFPSPILKKRCEGFVEAGADFVTCQHSHCIGCEEKYNDGIILYGQGNFIFNGKNDEYWNNGLLVELDINIDKFIVNYIVLEQKDNIFKISDDKEILKKFFDRSLKIVDNDFILKQYEEFSDSLIESYLNGISYHSKLDKIYRKIFKKYPKRKYSRQEYLYLLNSLRCEAHREVFIKGLERKIK